MGNTGAIVLANNLELSKTTKSLSLRHHFMRGFVEVGVLKKIVRLKLYKEEILTDGLSILSYFSSIEMIL